MGEEPRSQAARFAAAARSALTARILSALVMVPVALSAAWYGAPALAALVALAGAGMGWEWVRLARISSPVAAFFVVAAAPLAAIVVTAGDGLAACAIAGGFAALAALAQPRLRGATWSFAGTLWIALPAVALLWLERGPQGRWVVLWLFAVVWASDIGAYAFGRLVGGPKLAPRLSPNKTWAGAVGGLASAVGAGLALAAAAGAASPRIAATGAVVAIAAQLGDLAESSVKRHFHVKDSGVLIPGHGGLLDRIDSLLAATLALAAVVAASGAGVLGD